MNENLKLAIIGIGLGLLGAAIWYAEMFTDSKAANLWRRMNGKGRISRNYAAIGAPAFACIFLLGGAFGFINYCQPRGILPRIIAILILVFLSFFLIGLLPIKFPRWVYADWQYAKRHGLLDDDGNIDQEAYEKHARGKGFW
ncbi:hypothetical protein [uncultured Actinomyces sp.]|uniref:hypothetical protein n=1 Tax=uncultured Actinomyces sp. TaxID=249061 RepID=UPI0028EB21C9|nr:hypothetical protein [uncultured Actinomyces sp.]